MGNHPTRANSPRGSPTQPLPPRGPISPRFRDHFDAFSQLTVDVGVREGVVFRNPAVSLEPVYQMTPPNIGASSDLQLVSADLLALNSFKTRHSPELAVAVVRLDRESSGRDVSAISPICLIPRSAQALWRLCPLKFLFDHALQHEDVEAHVAVACQDGTLRIFEIPSAETVTTTTVDPPEGLVCVGEIPWSCQIVAAEGCYGHIEDEPKRIHLYDVSRELQEVRTVPTRTVRSHSGHDITILRTDEDHQLLLSGGNDERIRMWDFRLSNENAQVGIMGHMKRRNTWPTGFGDFQLFPDKMCCAVHMYYHLSMFDLRRPDRYLWYVDPFEGAERRSGGTYAHLARYSEDEFVAVCDTNQNGIGRYRIKDGKVLEVFRDHAVSIQHLGAWGSFPDFVLMTESRVEMDAAEERIQFLLRGGLRGCIVLRSSDGEHVLQTFLLG